MARVLIAAGASGGHVYPALATAEVLRRRGYDVSFAGGDRLEATVVPAAGFRFHALPVKRPPSVRIELLTPRGIGSLASIARSVRRASRLLDDIKPDAVLGMGGFTSVPVTLAAVRKTTRLVLHEQNAHLSLAQRITVRWCDILALSLPIEEKLPRVTTELVGIPLRAGVASLAELEGHTREEARAAARSKLGLDPARPTLLVLGGSLGSGPLNELVPQASLPDEIQILHLAGPGRESEVGSAWKDKHRAAVVLGFLESIEDAYIASDVALSRSGASTVSELAVAALPSVLVPLPTLRRGDQEANARVFERAGAAVVVSQSDRAFIETIGSEVSALFSDPALRAQMSRAARSLARPEAADALADVVGSLVRPI